MLRSSELLEWVDRLGVPEEQVRRDHLLSHFLLALPAILPDVVFFGGTALCRTHLPGWRLSEDIDLLVDDRRSAREGLSDHLPRLLRREYPGLSLRWSQGTAFDSGTARSGDLAVEIQLVERDASYERYPTSTQDVLLRYADLPATVPLDCPTLPGATAMKLAAWAERGTARDLCDLYGLARIDAITEEALRINAEAARPVQPHSFRDQRLPPQAEWLAALGRLMRAPPSRREAIDEVRRAVGEAAAWG